MKRKYFSKSLFIALIIFLFGASGIISAQKTYQIDATTVKPDIRKGQLELGGKSINGESIAVNNFYIERNGKPIIPVMGEFHYCRFPNQYWEEQIRKIKAGGVSIIATYVFWNLHEPKEGNFHWENDLNLRRFIEVCKANGLEVIVRIGPFDHGEMRNGGIPDWLYGRPFEVRSNDPGYLEYAQKLYNQIGQQLKGLYFKDGGPIIGIQLENEYQHSAAPWGITYLGAEREYTSARRDRKITQVGVGINEIGNDFAEYGQKHMQTLKQMAIDAGMDVPIYTATGWGFASIVKNGSIPVMAGYAYPFWEETIRPSPFYLFKNIHQTPDYAPVSYKADDYPSLAAELGTGMAVTYSRRPRVPGESFLPLMVRTIGSGSNGLGYYMYQGGTTPSDGFFMYSEGFGLNLKSYDYQAPIGEFGIPGKGYFELKLINSFLKHYGSIVAPLFPVLPETNKGMKPDDTTTLRYAIRTDGTKGFLFMHNFQDHVKTHDHKDLRVEIKTSDGVISFPETGKFTLKAGTSAIFPFNTEFGGITFSYATVQPLCNFSKEGKNYQVFVSIDGITPEIALKGKIKTSTTGAKISSNKGNTIITGSNNQPFEFMVNNTQFLILPFEKALHSYLIGKTGNQHLIISDALVLENISTLDLVSSGKEVWNVAIYPRVHSVMATGANILTKTSSDKLFSVSTIEVPKVSPTLSLTQYDDRHYVLNAKNLDLTNLHDVYIRFDYRGDRAVCMLNGEIATDNFYTSQPWQIGLKRYADLLKNNEMYFYFMPMRKDAPYLNYLDKEVVPDFKGINEFLEIKQPEIIPEYKVSIEIK